MHIILRSNKCCVAFHVYSATMDVCWQPVMLVAHARSRNSIAKRDTKRRNMNYNNANNNAFYVCVCASKITSVIFHTIKRLHLHRQTFQAYGTYFFMTNGNMYYILFPPQSDRTNGSLALVYFGEMIRWIEETAQFKKKRIFMLFICFGRSTRSLYIKGDRWEASSFGTQSSLIEFVYIHILC